MEEENIKAHIHFLHYSQTSFDETIDHLENLFETESLRDEEKYLNLHAKLILLGKKLNLFIQSIQRRAKGE